jgi:hypothetical protein
VCCPRSGDDPTRVETCSRFLAVMIICFDALVGVYLFRTIQCTDMEYIKFAKLI